VGKLEKYVRRFYDPRLDPLQAGDGEASVPGSSSVSIPDVPSMSHRSARISTPSRVCVCVLPSMVAAQPPTWEYSEERGRRVLPRSGNLVDLEL
jgi:hypothetical protein